LGASRLGLCLSRGRQAAVAHRTVTRAYARFSPVSRAAADKTDDYGTEFAAQSDSLTLRTIGIYLFLRTVSCSPTRANQIAHALKLPRAAVLRRLQELVKGGYVERVGNAYRVTDKVNISDLQIKLQRRIEMITDTAKKLSEMRLRN